jgi:hypothetical protein
MKKLMQSVAVAIVCTCMLFMCGCTPISPQGKSTAAEQGDTGKPSVSQDTSVQDDTEVVLGGTADPAPVPGRSVLGSLAFTPDSAHRAEGEYLPGGDGLVLEMTDAQDITWRLEIPAGAVSSVKTVAMTALGGIKGDVLSEVKSGVLLEPDGLQFVRAAHLTASGPGIDHMVLLTADHSGGSLAYEPGTRDSGKVTIGLMHFSSSFVDPEGDSALDNLSSGTARDLKDAVTRVKDFLGKPVNVPIPPDISFKCSDTSCSEPDTSALDAFLKDFMAPEQQYAEELHRAAKNYQLTTGADGKYDEALELLKKLSSRYAKKADLLIAQYSFQPDKCMAVSRAVLMGLTWCQTYGADMNYDSYFQTLAQWLEKTADQYLAQLREQHDFKAVHAILRVGKEAELLGSSGRNYIEEVENAMRMMVRFDTTLSMKGVVYDLKGEAEIKYVLEASYQTGTGTGRYTGFESPAKDLKLALSGFDVTVAVEDFNPCKAEEIKVYIDHFGAETETYSAKMAVAPAGNGMVQNTAKWAFNDRSAQDVSEALGVSEMLFRFELPFTNGSETMGDEEFTKSLGEATFRYHLKLEHTPK